MRRDTRETIVQDLRELGLQAGDVVFVSSDLMRVGYFNQDPETTLRDWISIFSEILGPEGTIVVPTYSPTVLRFIQKSDFIYTKDSESDSGSLANAYIRMAMDTVRGEHPTNSCIAIGPLAEEIAGQHGVGETAYFPYGKIIEREGKNLMLGTVDTKNCPMPFHYAQEALGHTRTHPLRGMLETKYSAPGGEIKKYVLRELGGCTRGVHKTWGYILARNGASIGRVGRSLSALVDTKIAFDVLKQVLEERPALIRCDYKSCISCYGRYRYNGTGVVPFYFRKTVQGLRRALKR